MSTLQVRDVPEELRTVLKARAARAGMSLSDYVRGELTRLAEQPTYEEWSDRLRALGPSDPGISAVDVLRETRAERDQQLSVASE
ncbi:FitA-like ribbon-helix-helix domain-containing protein [Nocardioides sp.]|uniref:FitA-like ribbon-helix-helix domain-containing protein n=1 Tax=Nocardioides sp. TaxID=35761 RepID=UPI0039E25D86